MNATEKNLVDNSGERWTAVESLPEKKVPGGSVVIHLVRESRELSTQWGIFGEQNRDDIGRTTRVYLESSESAARAKFEAYRVR